jgi:hypothetical protein
MIRARSISNSSNFYACRHALMPLMSSPAKSPKQALLSPPRKMRTRIRWLYPRGLSPLL